MSTHTDPHRFLILMPGAKPEHDPCVDKPPTAGLSPPGAGAGFPPALCYAETLLLAGTVLAAKVKVLGGNKIYPQRGKGLPLHKAENTFTEQHPWAGRD